MGRWGTGTVRRLSSRRYQTRLTLPTGRVALGSFATPREATTAISRANSVGLPASRPDRTSMEAWVERWWATRIGHRATTQVRDRAILDHRILPVLGDVLLAEITTALVQEWVNDLARRLAPSTVRRTYTVLAQLLDAAVDAGLLAAAPTSRIRLPRRERYEARFLTADELEHLAEVIREPWRSMVLALAYATLRIGEVAGLRRIDVDPAAGTLRVANNLVQVHSKLIEGPPKTAAGRRTMTMPPTVMGEIGPHLDRFAGATHVFCSPQGGLLRPDTWRNLVWRAAARKAGLAPLRVHDLKHTGVALLAAAGVDPSEISRRAGHSSVAFTYDTATGISSRRPTGPPPTSSIGSAPTASLRESGAGRRGRSSGTRTFWCASTAGTVRAVNGQQWRRSCSGDEQSTLLWRCRELRTLANFPARIALRVSAHRLRRLAIRGALRAEASEFVFEFSAMTA